MQQQTSFGPLILITPTAALKASVHGGRAKCLQRLVRMDLPVPITVALSFDAVHAAAVGDLPDMDALLAPFGGAPLLSVRPSSEDPDWGGPSAILNVGMNDARHAELINHVGEEAATRVYLRFVQSYAIHVARLDPDEFHIPDVADRGSLVAMMATYEAVDDAYLVAVKGAPEAVLHACKYVRGDATLDGFHHRRRCFPKCSLRQ
mgnify:CR=1 FL=1